MFGEKNTTQRHGSLLGPSCGHGGDTAVRRVMGLSLQWVDWGWPAPSCGASALQDVECV